MTIRNNEIRNNAPVSDIGVGISASLMQQHGEGVLAFLLKQHWDGGLSIPTPTASPKQQHQSNEIKSSQINST
jgi:hypothetical protein